MYLETLQLEELLVSGLSKGELKCSALSGSSWVSLSRANQMSVKTTFFLCRKVVSAACHICWPGASVREEGGRRRELAAVPTHTYIWV